MEKILNFDEVAGKYNKANKDATAMAKTKLKKRAELEAKRGEYTLRLIDEREALEQAMIKPNTDVVGAYEQVAITEARLVLVERVIEDLFPEK